MPLAVAVTVTLLLPNSIHAQGRPTIGTVLETDGEIITARVEETVFSESHPSRVLVRFRAGVRDFLSGSGSPQSFAHSPNLFLISTPASLSVDETLNRYRASSNVIYAEPDYAVGISDSVPADPLWTYQWNMETIGAPAAWDIQTDASNIVMAIVDTGIDYDHPDLASNLWSDGISNGFTCINGPCVAGGIDDQGHGTHVAGVIGAGANNGVGVTGLNWNIQLMAFKFLDSRGSGYISDAVHAFDKIAELKAANINIRVTNNSWGGGGYSQALKEAMAAVEVAGVVNVVAAGNSGRNMDIEPSYPAAYDNRGIVSVAATDDADNGAGFTNYGLVSVDVAAPGVSVISTVPPGSCYLCDPGGYRFLSGTSMATPHVAGVMAAMISRNPSLTPEESRDVLLDPGSYDAMTEARAQSTSSGGRLNFYRSITSPRFANPRPLNQFPTITAGSDVFVAPNSTVTLEASALDADAGDVAGLRMSWSRGMDTTTTWLFGSMLGSLFPTPNQNVLSFTAPIVARTATYSYGVSVADNRGGGASTYQNVTIGPGVAQAGPPTGRLTLSSTSAPVGSTITFSFPVVDPDGQTTAWDLWAAGKGSSRGACCYTGTSATMKFTNSGVYRISTQAIDHTLELGERQTTVLTIGDATGTPPLARTALDVDEGPVPLTVNIDMSASSDVDGSIQYYFVGCGNDGSITGTRSPTRQCMYETPGTYWLMLKVSDNDGNTDLMSAYVVATPATGDEPPPPEPPVPTAPLAPASLTATAGDGSVTIQWTASNGAESYSVKRSLSAAGPCTSSE